jgi:FkbM family methyltransferase
MVFLDNLGVKASIDLFKEITDKKNDFSPREVDKPLALYGAGDLGKMAKKYFDEIGVDVDFIVDIDPEKCKEDGTWDNIEVIKPNDISFKDKCKYLLAVCVVTTDINAILKSLSDNGWSDAIPFYDISQYYTNVHPLNNGWNVKSLNDNEIESVKKILKFWSDDISRSHYIQFIAWHILREEWIFKKAPITTNDRFFIPNILNLLTEKESFLDVGAYNGMVTKKFLEKVNGGFDNVFMVEPDSYNVKKLTNFLQTLPDSMQSNISIIERAVSNKIDGLKFFEGAGYSSQLSNIGKSIKRSITIDSMKISPSIIKLHIEGGELNALIGARYTIVKNRPIVMVTTYHNSDGIYKIPIWVNENLTNYHFFMRLHSWCGTGAVVYAIPMERIKTR